MSTVSAAADLLSIPPAAFPEPPKSNSVHIWILKVTGAEDAYPRFESLLHSDEKDRADRYRFAVDRQRYVVARGSLRLVLGGYVGAGPSTLEIRNAGGLPNGKPALIAARGASAISFNVSHSGAYALIGVTSTGEVGVDLEEIRQNWAFEDLMPRFYTEPERAWVAHLPEGERRRGFYRVWTAKEAILKCAGVGLFVPPEQIEVKFTQRSRVSARSLDPNWEKIERWFVRELGLLPGVVAAVALDREDAEIQVMTPGYFRL
jgi:4'-phosphopantetheinyl transferase